MSKKVYVVIHGHFYQPPREDPWTGEIPEQPSADPFHDWNERIHNECYRPNTVSRYLDAHGRIEKIVNNFEHINFNIGPTLFKWIEKHDPTTYKRILEADRKSFLKNNGHGNAIAQVYHHVILPIVDPDMAARQILWGLREFEHRFGRQSESIWLSETAVNYKTLGLLIEHPIKYLILSPYQAERIRPLNDNNASWLDVFDGSIDTTRPYRAFLYGESGRRLDDKFIDIFFYNKDLSQAVAFEHLLKDANHFMDKIDQEKNRYKESGDILINVVTDGESYGHHEPFGNMCLTALIEKLNEYPEFTVTNYGSVLNELPPSHEVILKPGKNNEGTAWSCAHGVGRWCRDCGCQTGGADDWNQKWRKPLLNTFLFIYKIVKQNIREKMSLYIKNPLECINDYITLTLSDNTDTREQFLKKHLNDPGFQRDSKTRNKIFEWLEIERNAMAMFTSCAWFFSDISGIETVQNLKTAYRVICSLPGTIKNETLKTVHRMLKSARSNIPEHKNGAKILEKWVVPHAFLPDKFLASYLMKFFTGVSTGEESIIFHDFLSWNNTRIMLAHGKVFNPLTESETFFTAITWHSAPLEMEVFLRDAHKPGSYKQILDTVLQAVQKNTEYDKLRKTFIKHFSEKTYSIRDIPAGEKKEILWKLTQPVYIEISDYLDDIFNRNSELFTGFVDENVILPHNLRLIYQHHLSTSLKKICGEVRDDINRDFIYEIETLLKTARCVGVLIDNKYISSYISKSITEKLLVPGDKKFDVDICELLIEIERLDRKWNLKIDLSEAQNILYDYIHGTVPEIILSSGKKDPKIYSDIYRILNVGERLNISSSKTKKLLKPYEEQLSLSPELWP